ncbi:MAG: HlyD family efflux transporter periplasmic adaptor subunit [Candidatus Riflebacteria bacterium]|nr:HlyD family efflux transporter periplasmic adaptor subunit [Candidatus Riflebacteria bacterium]
MNRPSLPLLALAILALAAGALWCRPGSPRAEAQTAAPTVEVAGNGIVEATEVEITTKVTARLASLAVRVGDEVRAGQTVALLENEDFAGNLEQASAGLRLAEARLAELVNGTRPEEIARARAQLRAARQALQQALARQALVEEGPRRELVSQLEAGLAQARATSEDADRERARIERLEREGAAPKQQADQARTRSEVARAQVAAAAQKLAEARAGARSQERAEAAAAVAGAQAQLDAASATLDLALAGPRAEVIEAARAQVALARGQVRTAQAQFDFTRLLSPITGRVTERDLEPGELVTPGLAVVEVADLATVWMKVYIPATQVGLVTFGQKAEVVCDSLPGRTFPGTVVEISETPEFTPKNVQTRDERTKQIFWVKIELPNPDLALKPGMPGDAVIHVGKP